MKGILTAPRSSLSLTEAMAILSLAVALGGMLFSLNGDQPYHTWERQTEIANRLLSSLQHAVGKDLARGLHTSAEQYLTQYGTEPDVDVLAAIDEQGQIMFSTRFAQRSRAARRVIDNFDPVVFSQMQRERRVILKPSPSKQQILGYAPLPLAKSPDDLNIPITGGLFLQLDVERARENARLNNLGSTDWSTLAIVVMISAALILVLLLRRTNLTPQQQSGTAIRRTDDELIEERTAHLRREIQTQHETKQALLERNRKLDAALNTIIDGVALWGRDGTLRYANLALRKMYGDIELTIGSSRFVDFVHYLSDSEGKALPYFELESMHSAGSSHSCMVQIHAPCGGVRWMQFNLNAVRVATCSGGTPAEFVTSLTDISEINAHSQTLAKLAHFDTLTGLPNRRLLNDRMRQLLPQHERSDKSMAVCYLDLDGFKAVNDQHGHEAGDRLLEEAARRLEQEVRANDTVARLGGDEFVVLLVDLDQQSDCEPVLRRIQTMLAEPYRIAGRNIRNVSASIGITLFPEDNSDADTLLRNADHAMYDAKHSGKNTFQWFDPAREHRIAAQNEACRDVELALRNGELKLLYRPQIDCHSGQVFGVEAVVRWDHPILGMLKPIQFVPLIEDTSLATEIGNFLIDGALRQRNRWCQEGVDLRVSANVFARQLQQPDFVSWLDELLIEHDCNNRDKPGLVLEVIESEALDSIADIDQLVSRCADLGVHLALDKFGTGYSSLDHLRRIPARALKIDHSFVRNLSSDAESQTLVRAIIALGHSFDREVVANGIEDPQQITWLLANGCHRMQGDYFAKPMQADALVDWLNRFRTDPAWINIETSDSEGADALAH